jgi:hypothetical protein
VAANAAGDDAGLGLTVVDRADTDLLYRLEPRPAHADVVAVPLARDGGTIATTLGGTALRALVDGRADTLWSVTVPRGQTPALTIDLGAVHDVAGVRCRTPLERAAGVQWSRVELSEDGTRFTTAPAGFEPDSLAALYDAPDTVRFWEARFPPRRARWVRLSNADLAFWGGEWTIGDLDVLAPSP